MEPFFSDYFKSFSSHKGIVILFVPFILTINISAQTTENLATTPKEVKTQLSQTVKGQVIDKETKNPISDVSVSINQLSALSTDTNDEGYFTIEKVPVNFQKSGCIKVLCFSKVPNLLFRDSMS